MKENSSSSSTARELEALYGEDYFMGRSSGYPAEGYRHAHPDWDPWLGLIQLLKPSGVLADLGSAFGYLVDGARSRGYRAFGFDISGYALQQEASLRTCLCQSRIEQLPLPDSSVDIALLFDVLEHLPQPVRCLEEVRRVLRPDGLLIGTTPDPIFFEREEATHFFERPPSFWLAHLESLGFDFRFRFSEVAYNFQFVASPKEASIDLDLFQHDHFSKLPEIIQVQGPLRAVPREGWGPWEEGSREICSRESSIYLLNLEPGPLQLDGEAELRTSGEFSTLRILWNSFLLDEIHLSTESRTYRLTLPTLQVPRGGGHLRFEVSPGGPRVDLESISLKASAGSTEAITLALPFDLFQRYRHAVWLTSRLRPASLLDVGGYLGDRYGHLASPVDFFRDQLSDLHVVTTDLRQCDHPDHTPADALELPYENGQFELVLSLDLLEHVPPDLRLDLLKELERTAVSWILLGAPFDDPAVRDSEAQLRRYLLKDQSFLAEHEEFGLPARSLIRDYFEKERGFQVIDFPSGYLPNWTATQALTQAGFRLGDYRSVTELNRFYNRTRFVKDLQEPGYRQLFLISKQTLDPKTESALREGPSPESPSEQEETFLFTGLEQLIQRNEEERKALSDAQFLANSRLELCAILEKERKRLSDRMEEMSIWRMLAIRTWRRVAGLLGRGEQ